MSPWVPALHRDASSGRGLLSAHRARVLSYRRSWDSEQRGNWEEGSPGTDQEDRRPLTPDPCGTDPFCPLLRLRQVDFFPMLPSNHFTFPGTLVYCLPFFLESVSRRTYFLRACLCRALLWKPGYLLTG